MHDAFEVGSELYDGSGGHIYIEDDKKLKPNFCYLICYGQFAPHVFLSDTSY